MEKKWQRASIKDGMDERKQKGIDPLKLNKKAYTLYRFLFMTFLYWVKLLSQITFFFLFSLLFNGTSKWKMKRMLSLYNRSIEFFLFILILDVWHFLFIFKMHVLFKYLCLFYFTTNIIKLRVEKFWMHIFTGDIKMHKF